MYMYTRLQLSIFSFNFSFLAQLASQEPGYHALGWYPAKNLVPRLIAFTIKDSEQVFFSLRFMNKNVIAERNKVVMG